MNNLTEAFTALAQVTTLLVIWYLTASVFAIGFSIYKYFRAAAQFEKYEALVKELTKPPTYISPDDDDRAN